MFQPTITHVIIMAVDLPRYTRAVSVCAHVFAINLAVYRLSVQGKLCLMAGCRGAHFVWVLNCIIFSILSSCVCVRACVCARACVSLSHFQCPHPAVIVCAFRRFIILYVMAPLTHPVPALTEKTSSTWIFLTFTTSHS